MIILAQNIQDFDITTNYFDFNSIIDTHPELQFGVCLDMKEADQSDESIMCRINDQLTGFKNFLEKMKETKIYYMYILLDIQNFITLSRILNIIGCLELTYRTILASSHISIIQYLAEKGSYETAFQIDLTMYLSDLNSLNTVFMHKPNYIMLDNRIFILNQTGCHDLGLSNQLGIIELESPTSMTPEQLKLMVSNYSYLKIITTKNLVNTVNVILGSNPDQNML